MVAMLVTLAIAVGGTRAKGVVVERSEVGIERMGSVPALRKFVKQSNSTVDSGYHTFL